MFAIILGIMTMMKSVTPIIHTIGFCVETAQVTARTQKFSLTSNCDAGSGRRDATQTWAVTLSMPDQSYGIRFCADINRKRQGGSANAEAEQGTSQRPSDAKAAKQGRAGLPKNTIQQHERAPQLRCRLRSKQQAKEESVEAENQYTWKYSACVGRMTSGYGRRSFFSSDAARTCHHQRDRATV